VCAGIISSEMQETRNYSNHNNKKAKQRSIKKALKTWLLLTKGNPSRVAGIKQRHKHFIDVL